MRPILIVALIGLCVSAVSAQDLPAPVYDDYDVFVVAGQSNARGRGDAPLSPAVAPGTAYEALPTGEVVPLADPVGGANTGSAWPAFANAYTAATQRGVVFIGLASNGSVQVALDGDAPTKHWDVREDDNLYVRADSRAQRALRAAEDALPGVRPAGWLWIQGGSDGRRIEDGVLTASAYAMALERLADRIHQDWAVPLYLFVSGTDARGDTPGLAAVRAEQNAADTLETVFVVYRDAFTFPDRGWMQPDNVHWSQPGLNEAGTVAGPIVGANRLATLPEEPVPPDALVAYPNPARGSITLDAPVACRFEVVDPLGRRIARGLIDGPTPLDGLAPGAYILRGAAPRGSAPECQGVRRLTISG